MENEKQSNCGCGCLSIVLETLAFMLICNFIGCEWAERRTARLVKYAHELWEGGEGHGR